MKYKMLLETTSSSYRVLAATIKF